MTRRRSMRIGGGALTAGAAGLLAAGALGSAVTLATADQASVTNAGGTTTRANIVVDPHDRAIYTLTGDSPRRPKCVAASGCLQVWPPVTVSSTRSLRAARGIQGRLAVLHHNGVRQLTLNDRPLYTFAADTTARRATGEGISSFGGTWHVLTPNGRTIVFPRPRGSSSSPAAPMTACATGWCP